MPFFPQFGGTNGVAELDVGQKGSTRRSSGLVHYAANVILHEPQVDEVLHGVPQQNVAFQDRLGWRGDMVTWTGGCRIKNSTEFANLRSVLSQYRTGSTVNSSDGTRGSPDKTFFKPTFMADFFGEALGSKAIMTGYRFDGRVSRISGSAAYSLWVNLTIVFRILG